MVASRNEKTALSNQIKTIGFMTVRSLQPGTTKLSGRIESPNRFESPISGRACAFYEIRVETSRSIGIEKTLVQRDVSGDGALLFRDGTGSVLVDTANMTFFYDKTEVIEASKATLVGDRIKKYVESQAGLKDLSPTKVFYLSEGCLQNNDLLYVFGTAELIPGTARQMKVTAQKGLGVVANLPEREILTRLDALGKRQGTLAVFFFGIIVVTLSAVLILYRPK